MVEVTQSLSPKREQCFSCKQEEHWKAECLREKHEKTEYSGSALVSKVKEKVALISETVPKRNMF